MNIERLKIDPIYLEDPIQTLHDVTSLMSIVATSEHFDIADSEEKQRLIGILIEISEQCGEERAYMQAQQIAKLTEVN